MSNINWPKLFNEGRVKAVGVPWNEEENRAIREFKIPVEFVRDGVLTLEDYTKALEKECEDGKPVERWVISELRTKASQLGINFTPEADEQTLAKLIKKELKNREELAKQAEIVKNAENVELEAEAKAKAETQLAVEVEKAKLNDKNADKQAKEAEKAAKKAAKEAEKAAKEGGQNE